MPADVTTPQEHLVYLDHQTRPMASLHDDLKVAAERLGVQSLSSEALTELATLDQSSESWSAERLCRLTASDLAAALGGSAWLSPAQVVQNKQQTLWKAANLRHRLSLQLRPTALNMNKQQPMST